MLAYDEELRVLQDFTRDSDKINGAFELIEGRTIKTGKLIDAVAKGLRCSRTMPGELPARHADAGRVARPRQQDEAGQGH